MGVGHAPDGKRVYGGLSLDKSERGVPVTPDTQTTNTLSKKGRDVRDQRW
jgi:hypothetical protein